MGSNPILSANAAYVRARQSRKGFLAAFTMKGYIVMASRKPTVRQAAWLSVVPQFLFMAVLCVIYIVFIESSFLAIELGLITYLIISITLKLSIPYNHRKGITLSNADQFERAIEEFQKSYAFFSKYIWVDKYRFITLLSSSKMSYREMALGNIAFCYSQMGNGQKAKEYYLKTLEEFPNSGIAVSALRMIDAIENRNESSEDK